MVISKIAFCYSMYGMPFLKGIVFFLILKERIHTGGFCLNLDIGREQTNQLVNGSGHISLVVHSGTHSCKQMGIGRCNDFFVCQVKCADKSCLQL